MGPGGVCRTQVLESETLVGLNPASASTDIGDFTHVNELAHIGSM